MRSISEADADFQPMNDVSLILALVDITTL